MEKTNNTEISRFVCGYDNKSVIFIRVGKTGRDAKEATSGLGGAWRAPASSRLSACASAVPQASRVILRA